MIVRLCQIGYRLETDNPQIAPTEPRMDTQMPSRLDRLLHPRSVAIVGASPEPGHPGSTVLANLERCRFEGAIHLVSRSRTEFNGRPCVPGIDALPHGVDVAVLIVPQTAVIDAIAALGRRGVGAAIVFASGYAEVAQIVFANGTVWGLPQITARTSVEVRYQIQAVQRGVHQVGQCVRERCAGGFLGHRVQRQ